MTIVYTKMYDAIALPAYENEHYHSPVHICCVAEPSGESREPHKHTTNIFSQSYTYNRGMYVCMYT